MTTHLFVRGGRIISIRRPIVYTYSQQGVGGKACMLIRQRARIAASELHSTGENVAQPPALGWQGHFHMQALGRILWDTERFSRYSCLLTLAESSRKWIIAEELLVLFPEHPY